MRVLADGLGNPKYNPCPLLVRMVGRTMITVIVQRGNLRVYRSTEMASEAALLDPQAMLDEVFPAIAYFQDTWDSAPDRARITGFGSRTGFYTDDYNEQDFKAPEEIRKANLRGSDLRGAKVEGVDFYLVDLREAQYDSHQEQHFRGCGAILESRAR